jgi:hypothetical protein
MGKCDTATASIGIKILLSDLINQINETNFALIKKMIYDGGIEDRNDYFNEAYKNIIGYASDDNELPEDYLEFKNYVIEKFKTNGSYYKSKFSSKVEPDLSRGCLFEKKLLVPIKEIISTERWGYERYGTNSSSCPIDFDLTLNLEEYQKHNIENYTVVFIIKQNSG